MKFWLCRDGGRTCQDKRISAKVTTTTSNLWRTIWRVVSGERWVVSGKWMEKLVRWKIHTENGIIAGVFSSLADWLGAGRRAIEIPCTDPDGGFKSWWCNSNSNSNCICNCICNCTTRSVVVEPKVKLSSVWVELHTPVSHFYYRS